MSLQTVQRKEHLKSNKSELIVTSTPMSNVLTTCARNSPQDFWFVQSVIIGTVVCGLVLQVSQITKVVHLAT